MTFVQTFALTTLIAATALVADNATWAAAPASSPASSPASALGSATSSMRKVVTSKAVTSKAVKTQTVSSKTSVKTSKTKPKADLVFSAATGKKTYKVGEPVVFTMTVRNVSRKNQVLNFPSGRSFDIVVSPQNSSEPVWQWSWGRMFTQELRDVPIAAGESQTFSATWDGSANDGKTVAPGKYQVTARLTTIGAGVKAAPIVVTLK